MLIKEIFNESIWADLNKGAAIGSSSLRNRHLVYQIRMHLETKFNKHQPVDIQSIMDKFVLNVDTAQPLEKYFERQQQCQLLLVDTTEPIRDLVRWVREYVNDIDPLSTDSWEELRTYFIDKQMEHIDDQATLLVTAGIANSAKVDEELNEIKYEMTNIAEKTE
jgi:hypothetical protein